MPSARLPNPPGSQLAALTAMLLIAQQVAGKAARDALFLTNFRTTHLPFAMAGGAVLSLLAAYWVSHVMARHGPARILPLLFAASACGFTLAWAVDVTSPRAAAVLVYLQTAFLAPAMISTFWSLINERFDPHAAKRAVARIASGGTLGGVLGGLAAWRATSMAAVLLFLAALNAAAVVGALVTQARRDPEASGPTPSAADETVAPFGVLRAAPHLQNLALLVALGAAMSALLDYIFSVQATLVYGKGQPLLAFFSLFWMAVGVGSFLLQMSLGRIVLERLGVALTVAVLPGIIIVGGVAGLVVPGLASASLLRGADAVQRNTLFRSAYELLYTPIAEEHKRATKALIDVAFDRFGTVCGSGITLLILHAFSGSRTSFLLAAVVVLALATLPVVRRLHQGYVLALQQGLREGAKKLQLDDTVSASTSARDSTTAQPQDGFVPPGRAVQALKDPGTLLAGLRDLLSSNPERVQRALMKLDDRGPSVGGAILLLAHQRYHEQAIQALRAHAPTITGQLIDALLDPTMDFIVRRRLPRVLNQCSTQRAVDGLLLGLSDDRFEVRYECGRALLRLSDGHTHLDISRTKVLDAIQAELDRGTRLLEGTGAQFDDDPNEDDEHNSLIDGLVRERVSRGLEHVFTILALHFEREPLRMAFRALYQEDTTYRGTALEYLDTVLPAEIHDMLWPHLGAAVALPAARASQEALADLAPTSSS
jgi:ATP:ADP antiporter, AAA family